MLGAFPRIQRASKVRSKLSLRIDFMSWAWYWPAGVKFCRWCFESIEETIRWNLFLLYCIYDKPCQLAIVPLCHFINSFHSHNLDKFSTSRLNTYTIINESQFVIRMCSTFHDRRRPSHFGVCSFEILNFEKKCFSFLSESVVRLTWDFRKHEWKHRCSFVKKTRSIKMKYLS